MATIAFIGLGNMGGGMAANLAKAGHRVLAFDLSEPGSVGYRMPGSVGSFANGWYEPRGRWWSAG